MPFQETDSQFKTRINYDNRKKTWTRGMWVYAFSNIDVLKCPSITGNYTYAYSPLILPLENGVSVEEEFELINKEERLQFEFLCCGLEAENKAEQKLFSDAESNTSGIIHFNGGPDDLGDLSLVDPTGNEVVFFKKNISVKVRRFGRGEIDLLQICRFIQSNLNKVSVANGNPLSPIPKLQMVKKGGIITQKTVPDLEAYKTSSMDAKVGDSIELSIDLGNTIGSVIKIKEIYNKGDINVRRKGGTWTITPLRSGTLFFNYALIDAKSLCANYFSIQFNVTQ